MIWMLKIMDSHPLIKHGNGTSPIHRWFSHDFLHLEMISQPAMFDYQSLYIPMIVDSRLATALFSIRHGNHCLRNSSKQPCIQHTLSI